MVVSVAIPLTTVAVPITLPSMRKVTVPPGALPLTATLKLMLVPESMLLVRMTAMPGLVRNPSSVGSSLSEGVGPVRCTALTVAEATLAWCNASPE
ncbi:hypothetical protein BW39_00538 [Delftia sp. RIT313]|nr:hypothetical protein BW39_00538 [Delftia sp. RIT313]